MVWGADPDMGFAGKVGDGWRQTPGAGIICSGTPSSATACSGPAGPMAPFTMLRYLPVLLLSVLCLSLAGCDNVAKAFGTGTPDPGGTTTESKIQVVREAGDAKEGRPTVKNVAPQGSAWPTTVPIVIEFSESIYESSIVPTSTTANDGRILVRVKGTTQAILCGYDFVAQGRVLILRPATGLTNEQNPTYEIVMLPGGTDIDGVPFRVSGTESVLAEFQTNQADTIHDGRILTTFPRNNARDAVRETSYYVFFDRPVNADSITATNLFVRPRNGVALAGDTTVVRLQGQADGRVVSFTPDDPFAAATEQQLVVDDTITFGEDGTLDFTGRTPFAVFTTVRPQSPTGVHVGNPSTGFPDKINRSNVDTLTIKVTTPADAEVGDRVLVRVYGGDHTTTATGDLAMFERTAEVTTAGAHDVTVDFAGLLGTIAKPKFDDGDVTLCAQLQRGSEHSGFAVSSSANAPRFDITPPTMVTAGAPASASGVDIYTDQEYLAYYGTASEEVAAAHLVDGTSQTAELFAAASDGTFLVKPIALGRLTAPRSYSVLLTDLAGNLAAAAATGNIVQRGVVTGTLAGTLTVEAYDHTTMAPVAGATVLIEPDAPVKPAVGQVIATTDANGRATFTGLGGSRYTITIVRTGYNLLTLYDTGASFVSLPLRPTNGATASMRGNLVFQAAAGTRAIVGSSAYDDPLTFGVFTTTGAPNTVPSTAIVPNRPVMVTACSGVFEPVSLPAIVSIGYQMLGATLLQPTAPLAPTAAGETATVNMALITATGSLSNIVGGAPVNFALATGLDTANLVGGAPSVRPTLTLNGFANQVLNGIGFAALSSGAAYTSNTSLGTVPAVGLADFVPLNWIVSQARDTNGRVSRTREVPTIGTTILWTDPPAIPAITVPGGAIAGAPAVTLADAFDGTAGICPVEVTATDGAGRSWTVMYLDRDTIGGTDVVQFPSLTGASVSGLQAGSWSMRSEARMFVKLSGVTADNFVLTERNRLEVLYARSAAVTFTIQ